mgnify:CR=1 FL=1
MELPPLNHSLTKQMIEKTKVSRALKGFRNISKIEMSILEGLLIRTSRLAMDFPEIVALDINPLMVKNGSITEVDARTLIMPASIPSLWIYKFKSNKPIRFVSFFFNIF